MSKLNLYGRPWVCFDASRLDHRRYFAEFQQNRTWGDCPVRFVLNETSSNLVTQIQRELVDYYVNKEFPRSNRQTRAVA